MNDNLTDITILLDRSGSMSTVWDDVKGGLKGFVEEQKNAKGEANFSLIVFDGQNPQEVVVGASDINQVELDLSEYGPRGTTPLNDAIGRAINDTGRRLKAMDEKDRPSKVVFVIYTDGYENASREFTNKQIKRMVETQRDTYNWQFLFLGADIDAITEGGARGFNFDNTVSLAKQANTSAGIFMCSSKILNYRDTAASGALVYSNEDRESLKKISQ